MRPRVGDRPGRAGQAGGDGAKYQHADRHHQQGCHQKLHFTGLQLLAQVFRGTANHQPGQEHRDKDEQQHAVEARADAAEYHLADHHVDHRHHTGQRVQAVVHGVDRTVGGGGGGDRPQHRTGGAEAAFLALQGGGLLHLRAFQGRVWLVLGPQRRATADQEQGKHAGEDGAALTQVLHVVTEGEHQRHRNEDDRCHLEQVAPGRWVFERVRRVDAEEATAIGTQLLDGDLAGGRPQRNGLVGTLQGQRVGVVGKGLRYALPYQQQREQQAQRQQAVEGGTGHVDPEVAQRRRAAPGDTAAQGNQHGQAGGRADKVLHGQAKHLAQVADRRLTAVGLPVGVGNETDGGVERQRPFLARQVLWVEWQVALQQQHAEQQQEADQVERQQGQGVLPPVLLLAGVHTRQPVTALLDRPQHRRQPGTLAFHDLEVEPPEPGCW
ncbi:hypothetical protein D3C81_1163350 [compost metagenome]